VINCNPQTEQAATERLRLAYG